MPKIIENLEARLIEETGKQLKLLGYSNLTIRSIAGACGVGVGTVYNYFPSKDALVANYLLVDWRNCVAAIQAVSDGSDIPAPVVRCIFEQLLSFSDRHQTLFRDEAAVSSFAGTLGRYHKLLRSQLAAPLRKFCRDDFASEFIAESLLTWVLAGKSFDELYGMIEKLF